MTWLRSTVTSGITPAAVSTFGNPDPGNVFYEGSTAFLAGNAYQWPGAVAANMQSDVGVTFDPTFPGGPPRGAAATGGAADVINPYSKHMAADVKFVEFMATKQADEIVARVGHLAPSLTSVQDDPAVDAANPPAALLPKLTLVNRPAQEDNYPGVTQAIAANVNAVLAGTEGPAAALAKMSTEINAALKSS
jgi:multiple sugar transport system substrate-binding protein